MQWLWLTLPLAALAAVRVHDFFEGETLLHDLVDEARLARADLAALDAAWAANPNRSDVVVSLTTIPSRIERIDDTLKSLLRQRLAPAEIRLNLPAFSKREQVPYRVPERLRRLKALTIASADDWGPATKLIPSLKALDGRQKIVVVDDDRIYPANLIEDLNRAAEADPGAAFGFSGWVVPADLVDRPTTVLSNLLMRAPAPVRARRLRRPRRIDVLQGLTGYLVRPAFFDLAVLTDYATAPEAAFFVDDVWVSGHCRVPKYVIPARRATYPIRRRAGLYKATSLGLLNRGGGDHLARNNTVVVRHLADAWMVSGRGAA